MRDPTKETREGDVHFVWNLLAAVPNGDADMVAAAVHTIFAQPDTPSVPMLGRQLPKVETMLADAADDIAAFAGLRAAHCKKIWSTNPDRAA